MHIKPKDNILTLNNKKHTPPHEVVSFTGAFLLNKGEVNFKGALPKVKEAIKVETALKILGEEVGTATKEHFEKIIHNLTSKESSGVRIKNGKLDFDKDTFGGKLYRAIVDPVIYFPVDLANSTLGLLKKIPGFKNAKFIDEWRGQGILGRRNANLEDFSNTMALQHCFELLGGDKKDKDKISREALRRCKIGQTEYAVKGERSLTRLVSGIIPAFFLANDAYNLSMYMNNNKKLARKEKKRRFYQELSRVIITAGATFATLGFFSKRVSSNPAAATGIIAGLTFASELIGRMLVGAPVYPIGKEDAKKYAKLQHKDKSEQNQNVSAPKSENKKDKSKSGYVLKLLGGMVVAGFLIDKHQSIKPVRKLVNNLKSKYNEFFAKDYTIEKKEFDAIVKKLRENGFEKIAKRYEKIVNNIIKNGNLTAKEAIQVEREFNNKIEQGLPNKLIMTSKELEEAQKKARKNVSHEDIIKSFEFTQKDNDIININGDLKEFFKERTNVNKTKDNIVNGFLALPIKFAWEILNMPYQYIVKPLIEIPLKGKKLLVGKEKGLACEEVFRQSVEYLRKNINAPNFKETVNKNIINAFDNVNKSNISSADLAGSAKVAVSTVTSGFLILDNYNMVMIDSDGKDTKLAEQKAKERTIQRIVRIAYGAALIKFFNGLFKSQYNASLLGAEAVTTGNTIITETLERTSVGMPLHEATREEIIENDNETLNAKGLKGGYFRFMANLTGKKSISSRKEEAKVI